MYAISNNYSGYQPTFYQSFLYEETYSNIAGSYINPRPHPREEAREERERRRIVIHMPPPVVLSLCTLPMPERRLRPQPRGVAWLVRAQSGQRERRARRAWIEKKDEA